MTPGQFRNLLVGKTLVGVNKGQEYKETFTHDGKINGEWGGTPYSGKWAAGKNNCLLLPYYWPGTHVTRCWKYLRKDGVYVLGRYNSDGTVLTITEYVTIVD